MRSALYPEPPIANFHLTCEAGASRKSLTRSKSLSPGYATTLRCANVHTVGTGAPRRSGRCAVRRVCALREPAGCVTREALALPLGVYRLSPLLSTRALHPPVNVSRYVRGLGLATRARIELQSRARCIGPCLPAPGSQIRYPRSSFGIAHVRGWGGGCRLGATQGARHS